MDSATKSILLTAAMFTTVTVAAVRYEMESISDSKMRAKTVYAKAFGSTSVSGSFTANVMPQHMPTPVKTMDSWVVPKTDRGRRIMELRRLADAAGEEFLPASVLMDEIRKNRR